MGVKFVNLNILNNQSGLEHKNINNMDGGELINLKTLKLLKMVAGIILFFII